MIRNLWFFGSLVLGIFCCSLVASRLPADDSLALFERRILPILAAKNPSSCSECHLSGVDLKAYIHPTEEATFAALRADGLIDVAAPDKSKLLEFIARKPAKPSLVTDKVRQQELAAFRFWIAAAVKNPELLKSRPDVGKLGPQVPDEVIRHARKDRVLASFIENIWVEVGRCTACHSPERNQEQVKKHGEQISWIVPGDPQATLDHLREYELIDLTAPEKSLLLLKPLNQVKHGGGVKLAYGDRTYQQFRRFLDDYAATAAGKYTSAEQLPAASDELSASTGFWLKLTGVPAKYDKLLLQADIYAWDEALKIWSADRVATGERPVAGDRQLWQQHLSVVAPRDSERAKTIRSSPTLPAGKYLVKLYIDQAHKLEKHYPATLGPDEFVGQVEVATKWPEGYGQMTVAAFPGK